MLYILWDLYKCAIVSMGISCAFSLFFCFCLLLHLTRFSFYRVSLRNSPGSPGTYSVDQAGLEHLLGRNIFWVGPGAIEYHFGYILKNGIVGS